MEHPLLPGATNRLVPPLLSTRLLEHLLPQEACLGCRAGDDPSPILRTHVHACVHTHAQACMCGCAVHTHP